ncbi:probable inactive shikimate kinase like 2, chloroplastic [Phalaenopsis equestris]|uniref:probable inactive shikimate kinase like 2, chloroplastic n=1 Tax=Phalaenopsis equestris TaxID=78828 RepID=UPI0009E5EDDC|nr:probable inactive shikimate kinase like 2, chloroplastic [Phalaenopsis equestris]
MFVIGAFWMFRVWLPALVRYLLVSVWFSLTRFCIPAFTACFIVGFLAGLRLTGHLFAKIADVWTWIHIWLDYFFGYIGLQIYTPLCTSEVLEICAGQTVDFWVAAEGAGPVAEAEALALQSLSSHVRAVVATLGGHHGAASWHDKWRHLHAGFTVWLSKSIAADEVSAREEAKRNMEDGCLAYTNADVVVKLVGWEKNRAQEVALACLRALKQLILSDKQITGKKSLYIRLGCRGDWPNIKPPGWDPSSGH